KGCSCTLGDRVLHTKEILRSLLELVGPEWPPIPDTNQPYSHLGSIAQPLHASVQDGVHAELTSSSDRILPGPGVFDDAGGWPHDELSKSAQTWDERIGDSQLEVCIP